MFDLEMKDRVALVRLNNPPVNAVSFARWAQLPALVEEVEATNARVLVLSGLPQRHFCGGNDFREFGSLTPEETMMGTERVRDAMRAVRESRVPAIAALHGAAMGSGLMLASACDIRLATPDAKLGLPEIKVGAFGGYRIVREVLQFGEARMMAFTGNTIDGNRAHQIGLVQELCPDPEALLARALELAQEIAERLTDKLSAGMKPTLNDEDAADLWTGYDLERAYSSRVMGVAGR
ncbi:enoyl-CoA hydratase/isomerase family protein [Nitratireductor kimnyeongensis]|uniref:Enoyl-CoA hydratase/isomerase family protein n=1 Tax=Nitratireductor kimnyeongensis TaxID=430679 RepID=A0ABW0T713_9HYPH|nr:enoyl-CoA hydratase/isomerase family protein [Nitratireductor kimnyeongensis]QZZ34630.1 enoyl-CoA hydratase/isomerase family protein [Nitratireductor kimnyeongensis]